VQHDLGHLEPGSPTQSREAWIARQLKFGVKVEHRHLVVPTDEAGTITPLGHFQP
jgi:hypothetical protein